jgi:hypothetical protein
MPEENIKNQGILILCDFFSNVIRMIHKTFYIHFTELTSHNFTCIAVLDQKLPVIFVLKKYGTPI